MLENELKQLRDEVFTSKFRHVINLSGAMIDGKEENMQEYRHLIDELSVKIKDKKTGTIILALSLLLLGTTFNSKDIINFMNSFDEQIKTGTYIG
ncbi:hypothetical protein A3K72_00670 [Candidatus Woesearchaeota archaeon RBG_13_36_6]|nr:MAG: hypothetical protein A3K72_00670 [Candidatus Woesearchaeota archaeon RBG_13_36_6]